MPGDPDYWRPRWPSAGEGILPLPGGPEYCRCAVTLDRPRGSMYISMYINMYTWIVEAMRGIGATGKGW